MDKYLLHIFCLHLFIHNELAICGRMIAGRLKTLTQASSEAGIWKDTLAFIDGLPDFPV